MSIKHGTNRYFPRIDPFGGNGDSLWELTSGTVNLVNNGWEVSIGSDSTFGAEKLRVVGGIRVDDSSSFSAYIEGAQGQSAPVSPVNAGRIRYNTTLNRWEFSQNGGAYQPFGSGTSTPFTKTLNTIHEIVPTDTIAFGATAMSGSEKFRLVGGQRIDDSSSLSAFLEMTDGSSTPLSSANEGRIRYNEVSNQFEISANGGSYFALGANIWTEDTGFVYPTTPSNIVLIGDSSLPGGTEIFQVLGSGYIKGKLAIDGVATTDVLLSLNAPVGQTANIQDWSVNSVNQLSIKNNGTILFGADAASSLITRSSRTGADADHLSIIAQGITGGGSYSGGNLYAVGGDSSGDRGGGLAVLLGGTGGSSGGSGGTAQVLGGYSGTDGAGGNVLISGSDADIYSLSNVNGGSVTIGGGTGSTSGNGGSIFIQGGGLSDCEIGGTIYLRPGNGISVDGEIITNLYGATSTGINFRSATTNTGSLGTSSYRWANVSANLLDVGTSSGNTAKIQLDDGDLATGVLGKGCFRYHGVTNKLQYNNNNTGWLDFGVAVIDSNLGLWYSPDEPIAVGDAVFLKSADTIGLADANGVTKQPVIGVVAAIDGPYITVRYHGELNCFSGLTPGATYYLSETGVSGSTITSTPPTNPGSIVQRLGFARNATTLMIIVDRDYIELM